MVNPAVQSALGLISQIGDEGAMAAGPVVRPESVLHIGKYYPPHAGGMETHLHDLVTHQSSMLRVEVLVANDRPVDLTEVMDGARIMRVACFGTLASQPICPSLPWKLASRRQSLVHMHLPNPWAAQSYLMSTHKEKLIITHHADTLGRRLLRKFVDPAVRRIMERAAAIIVTSHRYLESSEELADFRAKCHVVPLGIRVETFTAAPPAELEQIRAKHGPRLILAVGRLVPYKGFEFLLRAMKEVDATLLLIGTGPLQKQLENTIDRLGLRAKVHLLGHVNSTVPYYKAARMLVMSSVSRAEAFGLVQLEAMAAGIPVVNTEIESGVPEVSVHGVTGITVPPKDPEALTHAIQILFDNDEVHEQYGRAGALRARELFSTQRMAESTFKVYESV